MNILSYILWNPSLDAFSIGPFSIRWYSLMWLIGLALAYLMVRWLYKKTRSLNPCLFIASWAS